MFDRPTKEQKKQLAKWMKKNPTPAERSLWWQLRNHRLGVEFSRQMRFSGYILDFACQRHKLCVEVDGGVHDTRKEYDDNRDFVLFRHGWRTLRFKNAEVFEQMPWVVERICEALNVPNVGVRKASAKQKRRTAARIAGGDLRSQRYRWNRLAERPIDNTPRLVKPD